MRFSQLASLLPTLLIATLFIGPAASEAQILKPMSNPGQNQNVASQPEPYQLSSRFHLEQGGDVGYLVVKVEMPKGSYIYSLTQKAPLRPSKINIAQSGQFRLTGAFSPDRPPTVIDNDPVFNQRLEQHKGSVQFFVPIQIAPGTDPAELKADLTFSGQVCTDDGTCMPISNVKSSGKFAGYFAPKPASPATDSAPMRSASQSQSDNGTRIR